MTAFRTTATMALLAFSVAWAAPAAAADSRGAESQRAKDRPRHAAPKPAAKRKQPPRADAKRKRSASAPAKPQGTNAAPRNVAPSTDTQSKIARAGDYNFAIQHAGLTRTYRLHVPPGYTQAAAPPLLVALHGGLDGARPGAAAMHGLVAKADREGFILVLPTASGSATTEKRSTWNAGHCCGSARDANVDDVGFIRQVVDNVFGQVSINRDRIYGVGMSDGAMMAYRLACEMPGVFRAIVTVAGTDNTRQCVPDKPVSVLHIHARDDTQVPFNGGVEPRAIDPKVSFASVQATVAKWAALNGCEAAPKRILDTAGAYCEANSWCRGKAEVQLCVTDRGGHSWPGVKLTDRPTDRPTDSRQTPSQALDATNVMWSFLSRH